MSLVHRVIPLNKPFKLRGYTFPQWVLLALSVGIAFLVGSKLPGDLKIGNIPIGIIVGVGIISGAIVFVSASEMKPAAWWKNLFLYRLKLTPTIFHPHAEPGQIYPDPDIIDAKSKHENRAYVEYDNKI
jgi:hypothetical protein